MNAEKPKLTLSANRQLFGVCAGIAEFLGWKPRTIRVAWSLATLFSLGSFFIAYIVCYAVFPKAPYKFDLNDFKKV
jgi:phage shock protein PspC (stress-responsive transcriptional regulator)